MAKQLVPFPHGAMEYLEEQYGLPRYSPRYLEILIRQERFPAPIKISARRRVSRIDDLNTYAEGKITQAS